MKGSAAVRDGGGRTERGNREEGDQGIVYVCMYMCVLGGVSLHV